MIIQKQKPFEEIIGSLEGERAVFIVGCAECAATCQTGGDEQVVDMALRLKEAGFNVTGWVVIDPVCRLLEAQRALREHAGAVSKADSILVLACGGGVQTIKGASGKVVHPGVNSLFLGEVGRAGAFEEKCRICGECIIDSTGGICPVARCPKGILNGPCGGYEDGKCEVAPENDCVWVEIYRCLDAEGRLARIREAASPRDHSKAMTGGRLKIDVKRGKL